MLGLQLTVPVDCILWILSVVAVVVVLLWLCFLVVLLWLRLLAVPVVIAPLVVCVAALADVTFAVFGFPLLLVLCFA